MKRKIFISIFLFIITSFAIARADVYSAMGNIEKYFVDMNGVIVDPSGIIDLGSENHLMPGTVLTVFEDGTEIVHPITGKVLGKKRTVVGELVVKEVHPLFSEVEFKKGFTPKVGDSVGFLTPIKMKYEFVKENKDGEKIVENILSSATTLSKGDDYKILFEKLEGRTHYKIIQKDSTIILSGASSVVNIEKSIVPTGKFSLPSERFFSLAIGQLYKNNNKDYAVSSTSEEIFIFDPANNFKQVEKINYKFDKIANIEVADLDNDGQDEIFVSAVRDNRWALSIIFKHDGTSFKPIKTDIPYLFRSVNLKGKRHILVQEISSQGGYKGEILHYVYKDGNYETGAALKGTLGKDLFGFSYMDKAGEDLFFNIDQNGNLEISTFKNREFLSSTYYGDTINTITAVNRNVVTDIYKEDSISVREEEKIYVHPRIEIIDDKYIALVRNDLESRLFMSSMVFEGSYVSINTFNFGILKEEFITNEMTPIITDIFAHKIGDSIYIFALRTSNDWIFQKAESDITVLEVQLGY